MRSSISSASPWFNAQDRWPQNIASRTQRYPWWLSSRTCLLTGHPECAPSLSCSSSHSRIPWTSDKAPNLGWSSEPNAAMRRGNRARAWATSWRSFCSQCVCILGRLCRQQADTTHDLHLRQRGNAPHLRLQDAFSPAPLWNRLCLELAYKLLKWHESGWVSSKTHRPSQSVVSFLMGRLGHVVRRSPGRLAFGTYRGFSTANLGLRRKTHARYFQFLRLARSGARIVLDFLKKEARDPS